MSDNARHWTTVPVRVRDLVKVASPLASRIKAVMIKFKHTNPEAGLCVWLNPITKHVYSCLGDWDDKPVYEAWSKALKDVDGIKHIQGESESGPPHDKGSWLRIKRAALEVSDLLRPIAQTYGLVPGSILGADSAPLVNTLAGAALTGAAGYGAGWLGEQVLPDKYFDKGKLRRTLGLIGAGIGALPGLAQTADNAFQGRSPFESWPPPAKAAFEVDPMLQEAVLLLEEFCEEKWADDDDQNQSYSGAFDHAPTIPRDEFNRVVWSDPLTPLSLRAATVGLVDAAGMSRNDAPWISPADVASIAIGAGSGYLSGMLVGKTLGALAGLRPDIQQKLQTMGVWGGIIKNVVPMALGR